jgi:hypothetical protein
VAPNVIKHQIKLTYINDKQYPLHSAQNLLHLVRLVSVIFLYHSVQNLLPSHFLSTVKKKKKSPAPAGSRTSVFLFATTSIPSLGSTQLPIQWVLGSLNPGVKWQDVELYLHFPTSFSCRGAQLSTETASLHAVPVLSIDM